MSLFGFTDRQLAWVCLLLATLCGWIAFIVNIIFAALTRSRVKNNTNGAYVAKYGNAIWVSLAGAVSVIRDSFAYIRFS